MRGLVLLCLLLVTAVGPAAGARASDEFSAGLACEGTSCKLTAKNTGTSPLAGLTIYFAGGGVRIVEATDPKAKPVRSGDRMTEPGECAVPAKGDSAGCIYNEGTKPAWRPGEGRTVSFTTKAPLRAGTRMQVISQVDFTASKFVTHDITVSATPTSSAPPGSTAHAAASIVEGKAGPSIVVKNTGTQAIRDFVFQTKDWDVGAVETDGCKAKAGNVVCDLDIAPGRTFSFELSSWTLPKKFYGSMDGALFVNGSNKGTDASVVSSTYKAKDANLRTEITGDNVAHYFVGNGYDRPAKIGIPAQVITLANPTLDGLDLTGIRLTVSFFDAAGKPIEIAVNTVKNQGFSCDNSANRSAHRLTCTHPQALIPGASRVLILHPVTLPIGDDALVDQILRTGGLTMRVSTACAQRERFLDDNNPNSRIGLKK